MKKILILITLIALVLVGCNSKYNSYMDQAMTAIENSVYQDAKYYFDLALEQKKNDAEAKALYDQTDYLIQALELEEEEKYEEAIELLNKIPKIESESDAVKKASEDVLAECEQKYEESKKLSNKLDDYIDKAKDKLNDAKDKFDEVKDMIQEKTNN